MIHLIRSKLPYITTVCLILLQCSCGRREKEPESVLRPVRLQKVSPSTEGRVRTFSGSAMADVKSKLSFKISGTVVNIPVKVGDKIGSGGLIAELNPEDYLLQLQETEASLKQTQAQARNAEANYRRIRALYEKESASRNDLDTARASYESTKATVQSIQKRLELASLQVEYAKLLAPVDGRIAAVEVEENENVSTGQTVAVLTSGARHKVKVAIPENFISQINKGDSVDVTFDAVAGKEFSATVTEVGVSSTGLTKTYPVTVMLDDVSEDIRPGMAAEVAFRFVYEGGAAPIIVPTIAVGEDRLGRYVFIVEQTEPGIGIIHRRPVKIGELTSDGIEVTKGLSDGDMVVTAGVSKIEDGIKVKLDMQ